MSPLRALEAFVLALILATAGVTSWYQLGGGGLAAWGAGGAFGLVLCVGARIFTRRAERSEGPEAVRATMTAVFVGFAGMIAGVLAVALFWRSALPPFALSALSVYIAHRLFDAAVSFSRLSSSRGRGAAKGSSAEGVPQAGAGAPGLESPQETPDRGLTR